MNDLVTFLTTGSREWDIVLSVFISLASIVFFAFLAYVTFYVFAYKMMRKRSDWGKRAFFLILVSLIGLGIRFVCVLLEGVHSFEDYLTFSVQTIYATIGVFSFEGQENAGPLVFLYFYATLWVAVTYVVVIFTGFNYSLQSRIALWLYKNNKTEFYIFTKVTDESYALAVGIENYCKKEKKPFKIIFASDEIDTFDAKNELHKKIRSSGYYFISIEKKASEKEKKPIIDSLGIRYWRLSKVRIFAMERDENDRGNEIRNTDIIFDDIECMISKYSSLINEMHSKTIVKKEGADKDRIDKKEIDNVEQQYIQYFIYVNNEVNSEFFDEMLKSKLPKGIDAKLFNIYKKYFRIKGFSEAQLCGLSLLTKRQEVEVNRILTNKEINLVNEDVHRALIIGFGPNGQASLKNLFLDSAGVCRNSYVSSGFEAYILDRNIDSFSGVYELSHPSIIFNHGHSFLEKRKENINEKNIRIAYKEDEKIIKDMNFPKFYFYDIDCKGNGVLESIFENCKSGYFNSVIISMGNDERNIELANGLLRYIRQFVYDDVKYKEHPWQLDIFINLREENAEKRLYWNSSLEKKMHPGINVISYGDYHNMFTFENIISDEKWRKTAGIYNTLTTAYNYNSTDNQEMVKASKQLLDIDNYGINEKEMLEFLEKQFSIDNFSYDTSSYSRESSLYAHCFYTYYKALFDALGELDAAKKQQVYNHAATIEHCRWNRFVMISGFIYSANAKSNLNHEIINEHQIYASDKNGRKEYNKDCVKLHTDIVPTDIIAKNKMTFGYDYMNVIAAKFFGSEESNKQTKKGR